MEKKRLCFELDAADHAIKALYVDKASAAERLGIQAGLLKRLRTEKANLDSGTEYLAHRVDELSATDSARTVTVEHLYRRVDELKIDNAVLRQDADNTEVRRMEAVKAFEQLEVESESRLEIISNKCDQITNLQSTNTRLRAAAERERKVWKGRADKYESNALDLRQNESRLLKGREEAGLTIAQKSYKIIELAARCNRLRDTIDAAADVEQILYAPMGDINYGTPLQTKAPKDPEGPERKKERKANYVSNLVRLLFRKLANQSH